jgi:serine/threonine-protein kinase
MKKLPQRFIVLAPITMMIMLVACKASSSERSPSKLTPTHSAEITTSNPNHTPTIHLELLTETPPKEELGATFTRQADGMVMVYVPAGSFLMGSKSSDGTSEDGQPYENEYPQHEVQVDAFWLDLTEVTNALYKLCVSDGHCKSPRDASSETRDSYYNNTQFDDFPVINVNWYQAVAYCSWADARLPKEAEWAFAARGPQTNFYPWGNTFDGTYLNYCDRNCDYTYADSSVDDGYADTAPVGNYPLGVSWVGTFDMLGNVWEWVWDWHALYEGHRWLNHPNAYPTETYRVIRGGSWDTARGHSRNAFRNWYLPDEYSNGIGFRCAKDE